MHSFMFHLGDWYAHTAHLTPMEDLAYRRLIDVYYLHQKPPEGQPDQIARAIRLRDHAAEVAQVLSEFFIAETDLVDGTSVTRWRNKRCDAEIERYQAMADGGKRGAAKRWSKGSDSPPIAPPSPPLTPPNANHKPLTTNHEPLTNKEKTKRASAPVIDRPLDVTEQTWADFIAHRKLKRATVTDTVLDTIRREAQKAGWSLDAAMRECVARGWQGFKADWVKTEYSKDDLWDYAIGRKTVNVEHEDDELLRALDRPLFGPVG